MPYDRFGEPLDDEHDALLAELHQARATLTAVRRRHARREAGAGDVATAEYRVQGILDRLGWTPPPDPPEAA